MKIEIRLSTEQVRLLDAYRARRKIERSGRSLQYSTAVMELFSASLGQQPPPDTVVPYLMLVDRVERLEKIARQTVDIPCPTLRGENRPGAYTLPPGRDPQHSGE